MRRLALTSFLIISILLPQVVSAAWWNPFSWNWRALFSDSNVTQTEQKEVIPTNIEIDRKSDVKAVAQPALKPSNTPKLDVQNPVAIPVIFQIQNVKNNVTKDEAKVSWTTTLASQSRLVIEGETIKGYESINGIGTIHEVKIQNLTPSAEYSYKITAITTDGKITEHYNSFSAVKKFNAVFAHKDGCPIIRVVDSIGKPGVGVEIVISGTYGETTSISLPRTTKITNKEGEAQLPGDCDRKFKKLKIVGDDFETNLEVHNGGFLLMPVSSSA